MKGMLSPSLMCADPLNLQANIEKLDALGVEYIHLDFMDNKFVPNLTLDTTLVKAVKGVLKNMKRDIHIMAFEPEQFFDRMEIGSDDIVSVHYEACDNLREVLGEIVGESQDQIRRYIRLNQLEPGLLSLVDEGKIALRPAVELSYLTEDEQTNLLETIESEDCTPSLSQAQQMRKLSAQGQLDMDAVFHTMTKPKANQKLKVSISME